MKRSFLVLVLLLSVWTTTFSQEKEPIVILISLDGFRHDYVERFQPENLIRFISEGTAAKGLIPSFPTKTFPNHYTIATGMLRASKGSSLHHGQPGDCTGWLLVWRNADLGACRATRDQGGELLFCRY